MKSYVEITLSSTDEANIFKSESGTLSPHSVVVNYGMNMIPFVAVGIPPEHISLLCDFEAVRRKNVKVQIETKSGCLNFNGVIDGLSFHQDFGNTSAQLIIKSPFQTLVETFPRMPGFHSGCQDLMRAQDPLVVNLSGENADGSSTMLKVGIEKGINVSQKDNLIKYIIEVARATLKYQRDVNLVANGEFYTSSLAQTIKSYSIQKLNAALLLLDKIDITAVARMDASASTSMTSDFILDTLIHNTSNLFDFLISSFDSVGCALVISGDTAYVVPSVGFLRQDHASSVPANTVNIGYPSTLSSIVFNDNGFQDIKGCYVIPSMNVTPLSPGYRGGLGYYEDPDVKFGNIFTTVLPATVAYGRDIINADNQYAVQVAQKNGESNFIGPLTEADMEAQLRTARARTNAAVQKIKTDFLNNWAQIQYLQRKYGDRNGSLSGGFDQRWAPGAVGSVWTKHPGTYLDFFVTGVSHSFRVSAPNVGSVATDISFSCGRIGKSGQSAGVASIQLYDYNAAHSFAYARKFVDNLVKP